MCGIVGILGNQPVTDAIFEALERLEYRGYDSAGIAVLENGTVERVRAAGKLVNLKRKINGSRFTGTTGLGHTRWATHGAPNEINAHPHMAGDAVVVHNGIIENFQELKDELVKQGASFATETDSEVVAQLIARERAKGASPRDAVMNVLERLRGAFALAIMFTGENDLMFGARMGAPLAVGHGDDEMFLGSDAIALAPFTNRVTYLEDGDWVTLTRRTMQVVDAKGRFVMRPIRFTQASSMLADKGRHKHFMAKEIAEQPDLVSHTIAEYVDLAAQLVKLPDALPFNIAEVEKLTIAACGTAYYAGLIAKYWFEGLARLPTEVDVASEFRYREAPLRQGGLSIVISQSGETADTLAALRYCESQGQHTLAIVNVPESTIAREAETVFLCHAGPEIGVASTKAFTCQMAVLAVLAIAAARVRGTISRDTERELVSALIETPRHMTELLKQGGAICQVAREIAQARDVIYLGRGINFPIALEGALKLKEISYIHAEGYAAGELKHGPIALIEDDVPVIVIAPRDNLYDKTIFNMEEVAARGGKIVLLTDAEINDSRIFRTIRMPRSHDFIRPLLYALPVQLLAYHAAAFLGTDLDQPRNLAKSVTVE